MPSTKPLWQLPALLLAGLVAGALVGWLAGGRVMAGIALVAIAEILVLLIHIRRSTQATATVDADAPKPARSRAAGPAAKKTAASKTARAAAPVASAPSDEVEDEEIEDTDIEPGAELDGADGVDECLRERVHLVARCGTHEDLGGDVEGELLDRGVHRHRLVGGPRRHGATDDLLDPVLVRLQPRPGERLLHDPTMQQVLLAVQQHQAAVEERPDYRHPSLLGVVLVAVGVDDLGGVRA